jgi:hypothetical protein
VANEEPGRAFIAPEERPDIGVPEPLIEEIVPIKISAAEARRGQEKHEYIRGHKVEVSKEAERIHDEIHGRHMPTTRDTAKKATAKKATAKKATTKKATAKKATAKKATAKKATAKKATAKKATTRRVAPPPRQE